MTEESPSGPRLPPPPPTVPRSPFAPPGAQQLPPAGPTCQFCAAAPAERMEFKSQAAFVFAAQTTTANVRACRNCGRALGRKLQNRTLMTGWWGVLSFFRNWFYVYKNAEQLRRAALLGEPVGGRPANPGNSVFARPGLWLTCVALAAAAAFIVKDATTHDPTWEVGSCVAGTTEVVPVNCSEPHRGRIVSVAPNQTFCEESSDGYVLNPAGGVFCIDTGL